MPEERAAKGICHAHVGVLTASLRAPSAHNAQPWRIRPCGDRETYELHYDHNDYLPEDPDDRDAYLTMGAFAETVSLEAPNHGLDAAITPVLRRSGDDLFVANVHFGPRTVGRPGDPLSAWVSQRATNRNPYQEDLLPAALIRALEDLGNAVIDPGELESVMAEASCKSWANPRFVADLEVWFRSDPSAPDGFTAPQMHLSSVDLAALRFAFRRGRLKSKLLGRAYSRRDISMFTSAPKAAVLAAEDMSPASLFDAGRRMLRSWVTITAAGYACHPFSIAIDEKSTAPQVAEIAGVAVPVALYRIGRTALAPRAISNRRPLEAVLIAPE